MNKILIGAIVAVCAIGCSRPEAQKSSSPQKSYKVVEDVVGATTIKQGDAMKKRLKEFEKAQEDREKELEKIE